MHSRVHKVRLESKGLNTKGIQKFLPLQFLKKLKFYFNVHNLEKVTLYLTTHVTLHENMF